ncbi:MAG: hypothetical protein JJT96_20580 [Opitutales bacterium]|nr:hypothetical protein [Opitutales bacterium]
MTHTYSAYFGTNPAIQRYAYDAWGRERNPLNWNPQDDTYELPNHVAVHRGFTGHDGARQRVDGEALSAAKGEGFRPVKGPLCSDRAYR